MVKSKSGGINKLPKDQRCKFLIGPVASWFVPDTSDIWTQPRVNDVFGAITDRDSMDCDQLEIIRKDTSLSYIIYGSIGCFCYGEIHHHLPPTESQNIMSVTINRIIDVKEDNSRVICVRFLKTSKLPIAMILTESGSFIIHDCLSSENLIHFNKSELITKFVEVVVAHDDKNDEHCNKKPRYNVTHQINACVWPNATNAFLGISLLREKTNLVVWLKFRDHSQPINKNDFIESHKKLTLDLPQYSSPICCLESVMIDSETCLIAVAMDNGLIVVLNVNFNQGQNNRVIKLVRHNDQICSMSFYIGKSRKFPLGLLASVSRDGRVVVWDVDNEPIADYQVSSRINWYALSFIPLKNSKNINLVVSNPNSDITILSVPENSRSKSRLKEVKDNQPKKRPGEQTLRHYALIFNLIFEPITETLVSSSLDGNHILWNFKQYEPPNKDSDKLSELIEVKSQYLIPSMTNNSRTHMLRFNPIKEDLVVLALGKAGLRFYRIGDSSINYRFDMSPSYGLTSRRITKANMSPTSLAWSPSHEYRLAIGTLGGTVLRVDLIPGKATFVESRHKPLISSRLNINEVPPVSGDIFDVEYEPVARPDETDHDNNNTGNTPTNKHIKADGVYSMCWGPNPTSPQDISRLAIYAIGSTSHRLFIYHTKKDSCDTMTNYLDEFLDQSIPEAIGEASEVAWKSSMDLMALGTTNGKIIIASYLEESHADYSKNKLFRKLAVIQGPLGVAYIQCLAWHPAGDKDNSYYYFLAASSNDSAAFIFDIKDNLLASDVENRLKIEENRNGKCPEFMVNNIITDYVYKLEAHKKAISDIAWNPHEPNELATASFDRHCFVWSLDKVTAPCAKIKSKFSGRDRLFTLEWSLVDADLILTSGNDGIVWAWKPSENRFKEEQAQVA